jgi:hypothetical protein
MKFLDTHFDDYIVSTRKHNIHPKLTVVENNISNDIRNMPNLIFYGPSGVGKYTQMLRTICKFSPSELKYEKKVCVAFNKQNYFFKISDIHYEVDLSLLGCNSKLLWHDVYSQFVDIISAKKDTVGIIVCKYFNNIHSDLLDIFYSYMQKNSLLSIDIKFIILTEEVSFIPSNILQCYQIIPVSRPSKAHYQKTIGNIPFDILVDNVNNIKNMQVNGKVCVSFHKSICDTIIQDMVNIDQQQFGKFRDYIYDIFIYNLDIRRCIWYIISTLIEDGYIKDNGLDCILLKMNDFFLLYNNNYRPIYHLEKFLLFVTSKIHNLPF